VETSLGAADGVAAAAGVGRGASLDPDGVTPSSAPVYVRGPAAICAPMKIVARSAAVAMIGA
jgi:hypothetical protein